MVGDLRQIASVRRILLDEGVERGVGALAFSTGGGLDFWVLIDRALDIGPLWCDGRPVAWQSPAGFRHPALVNVEGDGGFGFGRGYSGFLMTCGLDHTRWPRDGKPQHGRLPFLPARLTSYGENWEAAAPYLFCEGEVVQWRQGGEALRMVRRIEAPIGGHAFRIQDRVENQGCVPQRLAMLYHFNFGYPIVAPGTSVELDGKTILGPLAEPDAGAEPVTICHALENADAVCRLINGKRIAASLSFSRQSLSHLQVWCDPRPNSYVLAIEPCTSARPVGSAMADEASLPVGQHAKFGLNIDFRSELS